MRVRKKEIESKKDLMKIEIGDILSIGSKDFFKVMDTSDLNDLNFNYCAMKISGEKVQFWFKSETFNEFRASIASYSLDTERFSKDEYDLTILHKMENGWA